MSNPIFLENNKTIKMSSADFFTQHAIVKMQIAGIYMFGENVLVIIIIWDKILFSRILKLIKYLAFINHKIV